MLKKDEMPQKFSWHTMASSGGTLSLEINVKEIKGKKEKIEAIAEGLKESAELMEKRGYIPHRAQLMSSRDLADKYGKTRQYWEKLLNEGKILYKETSAGRITTDIWVEGYLGDPKKVNRYVKDVRIVLGNIKNSGRKDGTVSCPMCEQNRFEFFVNVNSNINGICRVCSFHVHTTQ